MRLSKMIAVIQKMEKEISWIASPPMAATFPR
jgi:hypothetical protein